MNEDNNGMRYKSDIDINNKEDVHVVEFEYIDENKNVLDVGCACGDFGVILKKYKNSNVYGIERDKKAIDIAGKMSKSLHHNYIGTEHLLIGLLKENSGVAAKILNENGVELDKIVDLIKELIAPAEGTTVAESDGYSPRAAKVLRNAV